MTSFISKKLTLDDCAGEKLRQTRYYKKLKIEDVAKQINIRSDYIIALEEEDVDKLPNGLYAKKFLKKYSSFLGLNYDNILKDWNRNISDEKQNNPFSQKIVKKNKFIVFPKIIRNFLISLIIIICFIYLIIYFKKTILPPKLIIIQPNKNLITSKQTVKIKGRTDSSAEVKINGENILNNGGSFLKDINLKKGLNNIIITSQKKYSQIKTINRQILVK